MDELQPPQSVEDEEITAYLLRLLRSGRVKPSVMVVQTEKAFPGVSRDRIVRCARELDSQLLKKPL